MTSCAAWQRTEHCRCQHCKLVVQGLSAAKKKKEQPMFQDIGFFISKLSPCFAPVAFSRPSRLLSPQSEHVGQNTSITKPDLHDFGCKTTRKRLAVRSPIRRQTTQISGRHRTSMDDHARSTQSTPESICLSVGTLPRISVSLTRLAMFFAHGAFARVIARVIA